MPCRDSWTTSLLDGWMQMVGPFSLPLATDGHHLQVADLLGGGSTLVPCSSQVVGGCTSACMHSCNTSCHEVPDVGIQDCRPHIHLDNIVPCRDSADDLPVHTLLEYRRNTLLWVVDCEVCLEAHTTVLHQGRKLHLSLSQKRTSGESEEVGRMATWTIHGVEHHHYFFSLDCCASIQLWMLSSNDAPNQMIRRHWDTHRYNLGSDQDVHHHHHQHWNSAMSNNVGING